MASILWLCGSDIISDPLVSTSNHGSFLSQSKNKLHNSIFTVGLSIHEMFSCISEKIPNFIIKILSKMCMGCSHNTTTKKDAIDAE